MVAVRTMKMTIDKLFNMVAMWYWFVTANRSMNMACVMATTLMRRCAATGVGFGSFDAVFNDRAIVGDMVQMPIMQIVDMIAVLNAGVFAVGSMVVVAILMRLAHQGSPNRKVRIKNLPSRA